VTDDLDQHDPPEDDVLEPRVNAIFFAALEVPAHVAGGQLIGSETNGQKRDAVAYFEEDLRKRGYRVVAIQ
jgi:hypothetical protein